MAEPDQAVIVGAQRCGTTSVAVTLGRHPAVALAQPLRPEPKFFLDEGAATHLSDYLERHYPDVGPDVVLRCEKSTSYFESDRACAEIAAAFPEAHIVVVLRDPVARALSQYDFSRQNGVETLPAAEALDPAAEGRPWDREAISVSPFRYLTRGRYIDDLQRWDAVFGPDAVHVVLLEDLEAEPERFADLERALGLAPEVVFDPDAHHNAREDTTVLDAGTRDGLVAWFADANHDLALRLGRPLDRWSHA